MRLPLYFISYAQAYCTGVFADGSSDAYMDGLEDAARQLLLLLVLVV